MSTNTMIAAARAEVRRRHARRAEFRAFCSGGVLVFTGLLLAALYCMVTHRLGA
jgi:hypothetical protein